MKQSPHRAQGSPSATSVQPRSSRCQSPWAPAQAEQSHSVSGRIAAATACGAAGIPELGSTGPEHRQQERSAAMVPTVRPIPALHQQPLMACDGHADIDGLLFCGGIEISPDAELPEWVHVFPDRPFWHPMSSYPDHIVPVDDAFLEALLRNHAERDIDLLFDWEHQSIFFAEVAPAAGWGGEMERREGGLWVHMKHWTPKAAERIGNREYRYLSPTLIENYINPKTGKASGPLLISVGLVGVPHLELTPLSNKKVPSASGGGGPVESPMNKEILVKLALAADATAEQVTAAIDALLQRPAVPSSLAEALQLPAECDEASAVAAVAAIAEMAKRPETPVVSTANAVSLKDHADVQTELLRANAELQVIRDGIAPAAQAIGKTLWLSDAGVYEEWAKTAPKAPTTSISTPNPKSGQSAYSEAQLSVCRQLGIDPKDLNPNKER